MINWSKKLRGNIKAILWFFLITGLIVSPLLLKESVSDAERITLNIALTLFLIFIHFGFFFWSIFQFFDFQNKKFINPGPGAKLVIFFYLMLMSVSGVKEGGELIPTIAASVLILGIVVQLIFGTMIAIHKIRIRYKK